MQTILSLGNALNSGTARGRILNTGSRILNTFHCFCALLCDTFHVHWCLPYWHIVFAFLPHVQDQQLDSSWTVSSSSRTHGHATVKWLSCIIFARWEILLNIIQCFVTSPKSPSSFSLWEAMLFTTLFHDQFSLFFCFEIWPLWENMTPSSIFCCNIGITGHSWEVTWSSWLWQGPPKLGTCNQGNLLYRPIMWNRKFWSC